MNSDGEQEWSASCVRACICCRECAQVPCAGTTAGGVCDRSCRCPDPDDFHESDDVDDEEPTP